MNIENERFAVVFTFSLKLSRCNLADYTYMSNKCTKVRAVDAARLLFFFSFDQSEHFLLPLLLRWKTFEK